MLELALSIIEVCVRVCVLNTSVLSIVVPVLWSLVAIGAVTTFSRVFGRQARAN